MDSYESAIEIGAAPDVVWRVLTAIEAWPEWESGVVEVEGRAALGEKVKVTSEANPNRAFPVEVTSFEPPRRMVWTGGMPLGLFKGVRTYELTEDSPGRTTFSMREVYSGPLRGLIGRSIPDLGPSFEKFARGLKRRVESERPS